MRNISNILINIGNIGFFTGWIGMLIGMLFSFITIHRGKRFKGTILGFIGGLMLAVICFDIIPEAIQTGSIYLVNISIVIGLIIAAVLDDNFNHHNSKIHKNQKYLKAAIFMAIGIGIHNIPSGIALGSLVSSSYSKGMALAFALALHGIPEGLTIGIFLRESDADLLTTISFSIFTSLPMGIGAFIGGLVSKTSSVITCISLSIAAGLILYIIFKETLSESIELWKGRLTAIGTSLGLIIGIYLMSFFR